MPSSVVDFAINIPSALNSAEDATAGLLHLQTFAQNASVVDRDLTFGLYIDKGQYRVYGLYWAGLDKFNSEVRSIAVHSRGLVLTMSDSPRDDSRLAQWIQ